MLIDKKFLERHRATEGCKDWWLRNKLDFLHYEDLDKKVTGGFKGYIQWLKSLRLRPDECKFDEVGNMISRTYPSGYTYRYIYGKNGNRIIQINPNDRVIKWTYDDAGNMTSKTNTDGDVYNWTYDKNNNMISKTDPRGFVFKWAYDEDGNMISELSPNGTITKYAHDKNGNIISGTHSSGGGCKWTYDSVGNIIKQARLGQYTSIPEHNTWEYINNKDVFIVLEDDKEVLRINKQ